MEPEFLTSSEVAQLLRIHLKTLYRYRSQRRGPPWHRVEGARAVLYRRADIDAYIATLRKDGDASVAAEGCA